MEEAGSEQTDDCNWKKEGLREIDVDVSRKRPIGIERDIVTKMES